MTAAPQLENGYIRIANELYEAIIRHPFNKRQLKLVLAIMRKTYGFGKKVDDVTVAELARMTSMASSHASVALSELEAMRVTVPKRYGSHGYVVGLNKNYQEWRAYQNSNPVPKRYDPRTKTVTPPYQNGTHKRQPQKRTPKDTDRSTSRRSADRFAEFWAAYPRKVGKKKAREKWKARNLDRLADAIIADVKHRQLEDDQWKRGYVPNPLTYVNGDRWEDEIQRSAQRSSDSENNRDPNVAPVDNSKRPRAHREFREPTPEEQVEQNRQDREAWKRDLEAKGYVLNDDGTVSRKERSE